MKSIRSVLAMLRSWRPGRRPAPPAVSLWEMQLGEAWCRCGRTAGVLTAKGWRCGQCR